MASPSKEDVVLNLILESSPLKEWHFEEIVKLCNLTKSVANKWLKKFVEQGLLFKVKEKGKFPFFTVGSNNFVYISMKKLYFLNKLHSVGLIPDLLSSEDVRTVIIFGSISKGDWYADSDIDIFIFGNLSKFDKQVYETPLRKSIELHIFEEERDLENISSGLLQNVINGYVVKGRIQDLVEIN